MVTGSDLMRQAGLILQDEDHVRWLPSELATWLNMGLRAIVLAKPSAKTVSRVLTLAKGTLQTIPSVAGTPEPLLLINITRNIASETPVRTGGRAIKVTSAAMLDAQEPYWHDPNRTRFAREARHYCYDELNPLEFYVYPGNDGTGKVEGVISVLPTLLAPTGDADSAASYGADIDLPDTLTVPLLDYALSRAFSKDETGAQPGRAAAHYQQFATAVGLKIQVEGASSPNSRRST